MSDYFVRRWLPESTDASDEGGADIIVWDHVMAEIQRHGASDLSNEVGGFLLGHTVSLPGRSEPLVVITGRIAARHVNASPSRLEFTHDTWTAFHAERESRFGDIQVMGWYHTHPDWGVFLSVNDVFIHENFFKEAHRVALVIDPVREQAGFFKLVDGALDPRRYYGFTEISPANEPAIRPGMNLRLVEAGAPPTGETPVSVGRPRASLSSLGARARPAAVRLRAGGARLAGEAGVSAGRVRYRASDLVARLRAGAARLAGEVGVSAGRVRDRSSDLVARLRAGAARLAGEVGVSAGRVRYRASDLGSRVNPALARLRGGLTALSRRPRPAVDRLRTNAARLAVAAGVSLGRLWERVVRALGRGR